MIAPPKFFNSSLTTGADNGEKLRVGSSNNKTLAPSRCIFNMNTLARCPPDSSRNECSISSEVNFIDPKYWRMRVISSLSPTVIKKSIGDSCASKISS